MKSYIANMFALYLNCSVQYKYYPNEIHYLSAEAIEKAEKNNWWNELKLILKPLKMLTPKEGFELALQSKYLTPKPEEIIEASAYISMGGKVMISVHFENEDYGETTFRSEATYNQLVWLASRGYDINLIPDEYKILDN